MQRLLSAAEHRKRHSVCGIALCAGLFATASVFGNVNQQVISLQINAFCTTAVAAECVAYNALTNTQQYDAQVTPDEISAVYTTLVQSSDLQTRSLSHHLNNLRNRAAFYGLQAQNQELAKLLNPDAPSDDAAVMPKISLFANANTADGDHDATDFEPSYESEAENVTLGADYRINEEWIVGLAYGSSDSDIRFPASAPINSTKTKTETEHVILYGSWYRRDFALDMSLAYSDADIIQSRALPDVTALGNTSSQLISMHLSGAFDFSQGGFTYGPLAALDVIDGQIEDFTEQGSSIWNVQFDQQEVRSAILSMGAQLAYIQHFSWGAVIPRLKGIGRYQIENDRPTVNGRLATNPGIEFHILADKPDSTWFEFSAGLSVVLSQAVTLYANYEAVADYRSTSLYNLSAGLNIAF